MLNRIVSGTVATLALLTAVAVDARWADGTGEGFASRLVRHGSVIPVAFTAVMMLAVAELVALLRATGLRPSGAWAALMCCVLLLSPWLCAGGVLGSSPADVEGHQWQLAWVMTLVVGAMAIHLRRGVGEGVVRDTASTLFVIMYLGLLPSFAVAIRSSAALGDPIAGAWALLVVLAMVFASDIGALYVGSALGRRKLAPSISPAKTIAGGVGGVLGSIVVALGFWWLGRVVGPDGEPATFGEQCRSLANQVTSGIGSLSLGQIALLGIVVSVGSQVGDLAESQIKRCAGVKDSSRIVPGMGGVMDVIDGAIFAAPLAWGMLTIVWRIM